MTEHDSSGATTPYSVSSSSAASSVQGDFDRSMSIARSQATGYPSNVGSIYNSSVLGNVNLRTDVDTNAFIDQLVNSMELKPEQSADLNQIAKWGYKLELGDFLIRLSSHASQFRILNVVDALVIRENEMSRTLEDLSRLVERKWQPNAVQNSLLISVTKDLIFDPKKTDYKHLSTRVRVKLALDKLEEFNGVFTNPHRLTVMDKEITLKSRNVSNQYRKAIRDTTFGASSLPLDEAVSDLASKFLLGGIIKLTDVHKKHIAIIRRFARENPKAITYEDDAVEYSDIEEEEPNPGVEDDNESVAPRTQKRPRAAAGPKKAKTKVKTAPKRGGRIPKGQDWWSIVANFFKEKRAVWGDSYDSSQWKRYIAETLKMEERLLSKGSIGVLPTGAILSNIYVPALEGVSLSTAGNRNFPFGSGIRDSPFSFDQDSPHSPPVSRPASSLDNNSMRLHTPFHGDGVSPFTGSQRGTLDSRSPLPPVQSLMNMGGSNSLSGGDHDARRPEDYTPSRSPSPSLDLNFSGQRAPELPQHQNAYLNSQGGTAAFHEKEKGGHFRALAPHAPQSDHPAPRQPDTLYGGLGSMSPAQRHRENPLADGIDRGRESISHSSQNGGRDQVPSIAGMVRPRADTIISTGYNVGQNSTTGHNNSATGQGAGSVNGIGFSGHINGQGSGSISSSGSGYVTAHTGSLSGATTRANPGQYGSYQYPQQGIPQINGARGGGYVGGGQGGW